MLVLAKSSFWQDDWALGYSSIIHMERDKSRTDVFELYIQFKVIKLQLSVQRNYKVFCFQVFSKDRCVLTFSTPRILESCIKSKISLNFYFHASLWCLQRFYEGI